MIRKANLFEQLHPEEFQKRFKTSRVPLLSQIINILIWASIALAILQTEPTIMAQYGILLTFSEGLFAVLFTIEYIARIWSKTSDERWDEQHEIVAYIMSPASITDIVSTLGMWVGVIGSGGTLMVAFRLLRCVRLFTSAQRTGSFKTFMRFREAFKETLPVFKLGLYSFLFLAVLYSIALYFAEGEVQPEQFGSIPRASWCVIMSFSTIGFGDVFPKTVAGRGIIALMWLSSGSIVAMPGFALYSAFTKSTIDHAKEKTVGELTPSELLTLLAQQPKE
jgi:voltage-gated potassium channel